MHRASRCISTLSLITIATLGLIACGGGSDVNVAQVAGVGAISKATLEHWMSIEARLLYSEVPTRPTPRGAVPDPPTYTACIAYLKVTPQKIGERLGKASTDELKDRCARKQQELKVLTLNTLIGWDWTIGRGLRAGMKITDAEARRRVQALKKGDFAGVNFSRYLKYSGQTSSDMLLRAKVQLVEKELNQRLTAAGISRPGKLTGRQQTALADAAATLLTDKQWAERTNCRSGYVTSSCKQYKGSQPPGTPN
jgi:foldase protein PrsA